jgi:hypothetical protein
MAYPKDLSPETQGEGLERSRAFVLVSSYLPLIQSQQKRIMIGS